MPIINIPINQTTFIWDGAATSNWGGYSVIYTGISANDFGLLKWDTSLVPAGTINSVTLYLYAFAGATNVVSVYKQLTPYVTGTGAGSHQAGSCDWNFAQDNTVPWASGGSYSSQDYDTTGAPSFSVQTGQYNAIILPHSWLTNPNGISLAPTGGGTSQFIQAGSTFNESAAIPYLVVDFTPTNTTLTITGKPHIQDNAIGAAFASSNAGGLTGPTGLDFGVEAAGGDVRRTVFRLDASVIPKGTITGFRLNIWRGSNAGCTDPGTGQAFFIADANTWVEGTINGVSNQPGSSDWNYAKDNTQAWAGSGGGGLLAGCGTSGTDYDANTNPPILPYLAFTSGPPVLYTFNLPPAWAVAWRDGTRVNNGFLVKSALETGGSTQNEWFGYASEDPGFPDYFEIDYTPAAPPASTGWFSGGSGSRWFGGGF